MRKIKSDLILALAGHIVDFLKMVSAAAAFAGIFETGTAIKLIGGIILLVAALVIVFICRPTNEE